MAQRVSQGIDPIDPGQVIVIHLSMQESLLLHVPLLTLQKEFVSVVWAPVE